MAMAAPQIAILTEKRFNFKFAVCDFQTKDAGQEIGWLDNPLTAIEVLSRCNQKPRNVKVLTGKVSGCIALDIDDPDLAIQYRSRIGATTLCIRTGRGWRWFFAYPDGIEIRKMKLPDGAEIMGDRHSGIIGGKHPNGKYYDIECLPDGPLPSLPDWILAPIQKIIAEKNRRPDYSHQPPIEGDLELASQALSHLNPDMPYDEWVSVGMALHDLDSASGLNLWDSWSAKGNKYKPNICAQKWKSFKRGGITRATLFKMADQASPGWRPGPIIQRRTKPIVAKIEMPEREKVEPGYITRKAAAMINRVYAQQAGSILDVWRIALKYFPDQAFTPSMIFQNSQTLTIAQINRGLMYGKGVCFEKIEDGELNTSCVSIIDKTSIDDQNSARDVQKPAPSHRPSTWWKIIPFEAMVTILCRETFQVELERTYNITLATHSRMKDLGSGNISAAMVNRQLRKLLTVDEYETEKKKIKELVQKGRQVQAEMLTDLMPIPDGDSSVRELMIHEWLSEHIDTDKTRSVEQEIGISRDTVKRVGRQLGFFFEKQETETIIHKSENLPAPNEFNEDYNGFPLLCSVGGSKQFYYSAHDTAKRMEILNAPAYITWRKSSIIRYDPIEAAMQQSKLNEKAANLKSVKPRKEGKDDIEKVKVEWNGIGNPPNWTRINWAYPWLKRMGYIGDFDKLTNAQIVGMLMKGSDRWPPV